MRCLTRIIITSFIITFYATAVFAISDTEYQELLKVPYFKQADQELSVSRAAHF